VRIVCVATAMVPSRTASSIQVMKVCDSLVAIGHEVNLYLPDNGGDTAWSEVQRQYGIRATFAIHRIGAMSGLRRYDFCWRAVRQARRRSADLLYAWPVQAAAMAGWVGLCSVLEVHDRPRGRFGGRLFRSYLDSRAPHRVLPISRALERQLSSEYSRSLEPPLSLIAPDGIDLERYVGLPAAPEARRRLKLPDCPTAVYTGHLYAGRGVDLILALAGRNDSMSFVIAGGEPQAVERWRETARNSGLRNVHFMGFIPNADVPLVQAAGDFLLMPYARQIAVSGGGDTSAFASPMKMFEYLASGRVILSSDLPVLREVLNEDNAILLPPEDVEAWDSALREIGRAPGRASQLAAQARKEAQRFTWVERARRSLEGLSAADGNHDQS
jgi:glycosyltransferase involved in cell wall biosynthesis